MFLGSACAWAQDANGGGDLVDRIQKLAIEKNDLEKENKQLELELKEANKTIDLQTKEIARLGNENESLKSTLVAPKELKALQDSVEFYKKRANKAMTDAARQVAAANQAKAEYEGMKAEMVEMAAKLDANIYKTCFAYPLQSKYNETRIEESIKTAQYWKSLGHSSEDYKFYEPIYMPLLKNYGKYNAEVYGIIEKAEKWATAAGGLKQEVVSAITGEIKSMTYYKIYNRVNKDDPSIQHLDNILNDLKFLMQKGAYASDVAQLKKRMTAPAKPAVTEQPEATSEEHSANGATQTSASNAMTTQHQGGNQISVPFPPDNNKKKRR